MKIWSVILHSKQTQNRKKVPLPVTEKQNENVMMPVYCRGWEKKPQQTQGKLKKKTKWKRFIGL